MTIKTLNPQTYLAPIYLIQKLVIKRPKKIGEKENFASPSDRVSPPNTEIYEKTPGRVTVLLREVLTNNLIELECQYNLPEDYESIKSSYTNAFWTVLQRNNFQGVFINKLRYSEKSYNKNGIFVDIYKGNTYVYA